MEFCFSFTHKNFLLRRIAARRLLFLFRIRSGKNKYLLRRCLFSFLANKNAVAETPRHIISIYLHSYSIFSEVIPVRYLFSINTSLKINICFTSLSFLFVDFHNKPSIWKMIYSVKHFFLSQGRCLRDAAFATLLSLCPRHNGFNVFPVRDVIGF